MFLVIGQAYARPRAWSWTNRSSVGGDAEPVRQQPRAERARARPGEVAELAIEVRLVVVAAVLRDLGKAAAVVAAEQADRSLEAHQPGDGLWRRPDLFAKPCAEMPRAAAELARERGDRDAAIGLAHPPPRAHRVGRRPPRALDARPDELVERREPGLPAAELREPIDLLAGAAAEHVLQPDDELRRQLVHRDPEQHV